MYHATRLVVSSHDDDPTTVIQISQGPDKSLNPGDTFTFHLGDKFIVICVTQATRPAGARIDTSLPWESPAITPVEPFAPDGAIKWMPCANYPQRSTRRERRLLKWAFRECMTCGAIEQLQFTPQGTWGWAHCKFEVPHGFLRVVR